MQFLQNDEELFSNPIDTLKFPQAICSTPLASLAALVRSLRAANRFKHISVRLGRQKPSKNQTQTLQNLSKNPSKNHPKSSQNQSKIGSKSVLEPSWLPNPVFTTFFSPPGRLLAPSWRVLSASWAAPGRLAGAQEAPKA